MTQQFSRTLHFILLIVPLALLPAGCWFFNGAQGPRESRLSAWKITRLAIVPFQDVTHQGVGFRVTKLFETQLNLAFGREGIRLRPLQTKFQPLSGFLDRSQTKALGAQNQVNGIIDGRVVAYTWQKQQGRVWVSATIRLLETSHGSIRWARQVTGIAPVHSRKELNAGFNQATKHAVKEFIDDLVEAPT
jgi:hypothetical protein